MNHEFTAVEKKTAGRRIHIIELVPGRPEELEACIQNEADFGYDFIGVFERRQPGSLSLGSATLLFVRDK